MQYYSLYSRCYAACRMELLSK